MIFLGEFKAGDIIKYRGNYHNDTGTLEDPTATEAQLENPDNSFTVLAAPVKINAKPGHYGGSIDSAGFAAGQYLIRMAGTVATAKTVAAEFCFHIVTKKTSDLLFDGSGYIKSTPQTAVTVSPAQVLGGALQPLLPIKATATIEAPQGDAYPIPWALGSGAAKTDAKFIFIAKTNESDSDAAAAINQEITIADPANVAGMNVLTTAMTALIAGYHAKVKRVDADSVSNPLTVWKGKLNVVSNVG